MDPRNQTESAGPDLLRIVPFCPPRPSALPFHAHSTGFFRMSISLFSSVPSIVPTSGSYSHLAVSGTAKEERGRRRGGCEAGTRWKRTAHEDALCSWLLHYR